LASVAANIFVWILEQFHQQTDILVRLEVPKCYHRFKALPFAFSTENGMGAFFQSLVDWNEDLITIEGISLDAKTRRGPGL
jgi:hypothetical protein